MTGALSHLRPVDSDSPRKYVRVQLSVFYLAIVISKSFGRQGLCLAITTFIPVDPPAFDILSFIDPDFSHSMESIVISGVRIK